MVDDEMAVLRVRTPDGVSFPFRLASPVIRLAAWAIDKAAILVAWGIIAALIRLIGIVSIDAARGLMVVGYFGLSTGYGILLEWHWDGQTLGKRLMKLRVMDERGLPLRFSQVVMRNLLRAVDALPVAYLVGGVAAMLSRKAQRLGDVAAATIVAIDAPIIGADLGGLKVARFNSLRGHQHIAARLRNQTNPALAHAALQALLRREQFDPAARLTLFAELATRFRLLGALPPELSEGISDEQLVQNVVEVVFGAKPPASAERRVAG